MPHRYQAIASLIFDWWLANAVLIRNRHRNHPHRRSLDDWPGWVVEDDRRLASAVKAMAKGGDAFLATWCQYRVRDLLREQLKQHDRERPTDSHDLDDRYRIDEDDVGRKRDIRIRVERYAARLQGKDRLIVDGLLGGRRISAIARAYGISASTLYGRRERIRNELRPIVADIVDS